MCSINVTEHNKKLWLKNCIIMKQTVIYFLMVKKSNS